MNNKRKNQTKKIENFINSFDKGFPDELRDLSRSARENLTEQKDFSFSDWETNPNAPQPIDFRNINKSSEWLSKSKKHILKTINELDDKYFDYLYEDYNHWFNEYEAGGSVSENEKHSKGFQVFNYTDNIFASPETFKDKKSANNFIKKFRDRFKTQGYYRDNRWNKIDPKDIELEVIPTGFKVFETGGKIAYETASNLLNDLFFEVNEFYTKWDNGETTDDETIKFIEKIKTMLNEKKMETGGKIAYETASNLLNDLFFEVNEFYTKWDNGETTDDETIKFIEKIKTMLNEKKMETGGLIDKNGNKFDSKHKIVKEVVKKLKPIAFSSVGSGGGFEHDFFLLPDGSVLSFHYAQGGVYISGKNKYSKDDFLKEDEEYGYNNKIEVDFIEDEDPELTERSLVDTYDEFGYDGGNGDFDSWKISSDELLKRIKGTKSYDQGGKIDYSGYSVYGNGEVQAKVYDMDEESYYVEVDNKSNLKFNNKLELDRYLESEGFVYQSYTTDENYETGGKMPESVNEDQELVLLNENEDNTWSVEELFGKKRLIESGFNSVEEAENYATGLGYTPTLYKDADEFANDLGGAFESGGSIKEKSGYYVTWFEDGQEQFETFNGKELKEAKDFFNFIKNEKFYYEKPKVVLTSMEDGQVLMGKQFEQGGKIESKKDDLKEYIKNIAKTHNVDLEFGGYEEYDGENVFFVHYEKSKEKLVETKLNEWLKNSNLPNSTVYVSTDDFSDKGGGYWTMVIEQREEESEEQEYYDSYESVKPLHDIVKDYPGVTDLSEIDNPDDQGVLGENFSFNFNGNEVRIWYDPGFQEFTMSIDKGNTMEEDAVDEAELIAFLENKEEFAFGGVVKNKEDLKALRIALAYADEKSKPEIKNAITRLKGPYEYEWNKDKSSTELNLTIEVKSFTTKYNEPGKKFPGYVRLIFSKDLDNRKSQLYVNENYYAKKVENDYKSIKKMTTKLVKYAIGFEEVDYYDNMTDVYTVPYIYMKKGMRKAKIELEEYGSIPKDWIQNISITFEYTKQVKLFLRIINKMQGYLNAFEEKEMTKWLKSCLTYPGKSVSDPVGYGSYIQTEYLKDDYYDKGGKITDESLEVGQEYVDEDGHKMRITKITGNQIHSALKFTWDKKYEKNTPDSKSNWLKVLKENKFKLVQ